MSTQNYDSLAGYYVNEKQENFYKTRASWSKWHTAHKRIFFFLKKGKKY